MRKPVLIFEVEQDNNEDEEKESMFLNTKHQIKKSKPTLPIFEQVNNYTITTGSLSPAQPSALNLSHIISSNNGYNCKSTEFIYKILVESGDNVYYPYFLCEPYGQVKLWRFFLYNDARMGGDPIIIDSHFVLKLIVNEKASVSYTQNIYYGRENDLEMAKNRVNVQWTPLFEMNLFHSASHNFNRITSFAVCYITPAESELTINNGEINFIATDAVFF